MTPEELNELYRAMLAVDKAYSAALRHGYGERAIEVRYRPEEQSEKERLLGEASAVAYKAWRAYWLEAQR